MAPTTHVVVSLKSDGSATTSSPASRSSLAASSTALLPAASERGASNSSSATSDSLPDRSASDELYPVERLGVETTNVPSGSDAVVPSGNSASR